jgi:hypothetical protein
MAQHARLYVHLLFISNLDLDNLSLIYCTLYTVVMATAKKGDNTTQTETSSFFLFVLLQPEQQLKQHAQYSTVQQSLIRS